MHKVRNIIDKIKRVSAGEDYCKLMSRLPFNTDFDSVNMIIYNFLKSDAIKSSKTYIAKIYRNIDNWS